MAATPYRIFVGSANTGLSLAFAVFARADTGSPLTRPTITESPSGGGWYAFGYDWATAPSGVTAIQWSIPPINGVEYGDVITAAVSSTASSYVPPVAGTPLPGQVTLASLRLAAQQRADMVNSGFVTPAEWTTFLNGSWARLYGLLIEKYGNDYYAPERYRFTTVTGTDTYSLPDGSGLFLAEDGITAARPFFKLLGLDVQQSGTITGWARLKPFPMAERNAGIAIGGSPALPTLRPRYRLAKNALWLAPQPQGGLVLRALYAPRLQPLVLDADLIDGVNGWEEYVIVDAARKALQKEESDTSELRAELADIVARIEHEAENRDAGEPATVADVQRGGVDLVDGWPY